MIIIMIMNKNWIVIDVPSYPTWVVCFFHVCLLFLYCVFFFFSSVFNEVVYGVFWLFSGITDYVDSCVFDHIPDLRFELSVNYGSGTVLTRHESSDICHLKLLQCLQSGRTTWVRSFNLCESCSHNLINKQNSKLLPRKNSSSWNSACDHVLSIYD